MTTDVTVYDHSPIDTAALCGVPIPISTRVRGLPHCTAVSDSIIDDARATVNQWFVECVGQPRELALDCLSHDISAGTIILYGKVIWSNDDQFVNFKLIARCDPKPPEILETYATITDIMRSAISFHNMQESILANRKDNLIAIKVNKNDDA